MKFVNPQGDPDTVSLASVDGSLRKESIKTEEPAQPKDVADGTTEEDKDSIRDRSKSISDQLSKVRGTVINASYKKISFSKGNFFYFLRVK